MPNIKIQTTTSLSVPKGTKIITNDEWITLSRKDAGDFLLFTCVTDEIHSYDLNDEGNWDRYTKDELKKVIAL